MDFTMITTTYNDENNVKRYLDNIEKQNVKPTTLVVVDGGSKDNTVKYIKALSSDYSYKIEVLANLGRLNIAQGYNEAVKHSKTELLLLTGVGNYYSSNFCDSMLGYYTAHEVDIVYTPIVGINANRFSKAFNIAFVGGEKGKDFGYASNRGVLLSRKVFDKIGFFYEKFVYAGEDTEFFIRAEKAGLKSGYNTDCFVYWETPTDFRQYLKKNKVNAIADMQCESNAHILKHIAIRMGLIGATVVGTFVSPWIGVGLWMAVVCAIIWKIKSLNLAAILLRLHFIFLPSYYYAKNNKYFSKQYKVKLEEEIR